MLIIYLPSSLGVPLPAVPVPDGRGRDGAAPRADLLARAAVARRGHAPHVVAHRLRAARHVPHRVRRPPLPLRVRPLRQARAAQADRARKALLIEERTCHTLTVSA